MRISGPEPSQVFGTELRLDCVIHTFIIHTSDDDPEVKHSNNHRFSFFLEEILY